MQSHSFKEEKYVRAFCNLTIAAANRPQSNNFLRRDIRFLGNILGEVLIHQGGQELLNCVEQIREQSKSLRAEFIAELFEQFKETITSLNPVIRHQVVRAFAIYFQLVNIAEQNHRIRRKRDYELSAGESVQRGSIESAIKRLKDRDITIETVHRSLMKFRLSWSLLLIRLKQQDASC